MAENLCRIHFAFFLIASITLNCKRLKLDLCIMTDLRRSMQEDPCSIVSAISDAQYLQRLHLKSPSRSQKTYYDKYLFLTCKLTEQSMILKYQ